MEVAGGKRGVEVRRLSGSDPDSTLLQLTDSDELENQHTYYDICPWSHDGRFVVFSSAPLNADWGAFGHDTLACRTGRVNVMDTETMEIWELADDAIYMKHGGAFTMWHPDQYRICYRAGEDKSATVDLETGEKTDLPVRVREISSDGESVVFVSRSPHSGNQGAAVGLMPADGGECCELVDREQLHALTPNRDEFRPEDMLLGNTKWRPGSPHVLIAMWIYPHPESRRSLYVASRDGSEVRWLSFFGGHHSWTPDGRKVLFVDHREGAGGRGQGRFLHTVDFDGSNRQCIFKKPAGSHPLMHPGGTAVLDSSNEGVYVAHLEEQRIQLLAEFATQFQGDHHGTHAHPVWNRDGSHILYNSAESGHSELLLLEY